MNVQKFRYCSGCGVSWQSRETFLLDPKITLIEYVVNFEKLVAGLFKFRHCCGYLVAIKAEEFMDLCKGPFFGENKAQTSGCPEYCLYAYELRVCPNTCECASVRTLLPLLSNYSEMATQGAG
jgi:hypothetical protein